MALISKLLLLFALSIPGWSTNFPGTQAFYRFESNLNDSAGLASVGVASGTVFYVTGCAATWDGGTTGIQNDAGSGTYVDFPTALINANIGQIEWTGTNSTDVTSNQMLLWLGGDGVANNRVIEYHVITSNHFILVNGANACLNVTPAASTNTSYYYMLRWDTNKTEAWIATYTLSTGAIGTKVLVCTGGAPTWGTINTNRIFNSFNNLDIYQGKGFDNLRYLNVWNENWPTLDLSNTNRSMDLDNFLYPDMSFNWVRKLVARIPGAWMAVASMPLEAHTQNQRFEQYSNITSAYQNNVRRNRLSFTPTPTPSPVFTPTPRVSRTPSKTPTP